jgi:5-hydroxyisourate hydrolase-like protein (transthyretin family)
MGLSTHVLDTMHGCPAAGMQVSLYTTEGQFATLVKSFTLNADGRNPDGPLYDNASLQKGTYRLVFDVAGYFKAKGGRCLPTLPCTALGQSMELFNLSRLLNPNLFVAEIPPQGW